MPTNSYIAKLKARLDQAIIQRDHWKQLAENRNSIVVTEVCPESRSVEEYVIDADSVRASWRLIRGYREQIEALRLQNAMFATAAANIDRERDALHAEAEAMRVALLEIASANPAERGIEWAKSYASDGLKGAGSDLYARWLDTFKEAEALRAENAALRAEQGERQEAVVYAVHAKGAQVDHHCPLVSPDMAADYLPGCATPLYTTPQPAPAQDVAGLVEAAKKADDALSALVRNDQPLETLTRKYGSDWSAAIDKVRTELVIRIAARDKQSGGEG